MSEYHKIETLYERDEKTFKLMEPFVLKNRVYGLLKSWHWTQKVDGTNIRVMWDHTNEVVRFGGRTDNAQIHADLFAYLQDTFTPKKMREIFPDADAVIYGEGFGAGIQGGGDYSAEKRFITFDVLVDHKWWLSYENICDVADKLSVPVVHSFGEMTLEEATAMVQKGFKSPLGDGKKDAEGLVGRPCEALFDKKGHRLIVKLKTKDFAKKVMSPKDPFFAAKGIESRD